MTDPIDLARLEDFADGTPDGLRQLVELYLQDSQETLAALRDAWAAVDRERLRLLAHRLGGTCAAVGARRLAGHLFDLEQRAATVSAPELATVMATLEREVDSTVQFLTAYLEGRCKP